MKRVARKLKRFANSTVKIARSKLRIGRLPARIVFIHLPKTGGRSLVTTLRYRLPLHPALIIKNEEQYVAAKNRPDDWLIGFDIVAGHFDGDFADRIAEPKTVITCVREPVDRTISLYYFLRNLPERKIGRTLFELIREMPLLDYVSSDHPLIRPAVSNSQARQLAGWATCDSLSPSDEGLAELAIRRLRKVDHLLVTEFLDADLPPLMEKIGLPPLVEQRNRGNRRIAPADLSPEVRQAIEARTGADRKLYEFALRSRINKADA